MELNLVLSILKEGLKLWNNQEASKYLDRVISLEKEYYEEIQKPSDERSDFRIDSILLELQIISQSFVQYFNKQGFDKT